MKETPNDDDEMAGRRPLDTCCICRCRYLGILFVLLPGRLLYIELKPFLIVNYYIQCAVARDTFKIAMEYRLHVHLPPGSRSTVTCSRVCQSGESALHVEQASQKEIKNGEEGRSSQTPRGTTKRNMCQICRSAAHKSIDDVAPWRPATNKQQR